MFQLCSDVLTQHNKMSDDIVSAVFHDVLTQHNKMSDDIVSAVVHDVLTQHNKMSYQCTSPLLQCSVSIYMLSPYCDIIRLYGVPVT